MFPEKNRDYIHEFMDFLLQENCPPSVTIPYNRQKQKVEENRQYKEVISDEKEVHYEDFTQTAPEDLRETILHATSHPATNDDDFDEEDDLDVGLNYDWHIPSTKVSVRRKYRDYYNT